MIKFGLMFIVALGIGSTGCTFQAGPSSGKLVYTPAKYEQGWKQVRPERQTHRPNGPRPRPNSR